jgi:hypothetical protein
MAATLYLGPLPLPMLGPAPASEEPEEPAATDIRIIRSGAMTMRLDTLGVLTLRRASSGRIIQRRTTSGRLGGRD